MAALLCLKLDLPFEQDPTLQIHWRKHCCSACGSERIVRDQCIGDVMKHRPGKPMLLLRRAVHLQRNDDRKLCSTGSRKAINSRHMQKDHGSKSQRRYRRGDERGVRHRLGNFTEVLNGAERVAALSAQVKSNTAVKRLHTYMRERQLFESERRDTG